LYLPVERRALPTGWAVTVNTEIAKTSQFFPPQFKLIADGQKQTLKPLHPMSAFPRNRTFVGMSAMFARAKDGHLATPVPFLAPLVTGSGLDSLLTGF
jgi:hypothetical protein